MNYRLLHYIICVMLCNVYFILSRRFRKTRQIYKSASLPVSAFILSFTAFCPAFDVAIVLPCFHFYFSSMFNKKWFGWHLSKSQICEIFAQLIGLLSLNFWIVLSASNFSFRSLVVLYPLSFSACNTSILYTNGIAIFLSFW